jgi:hypothetical protein
VQENKQVTLVGEVRSIEEWKNPLTGLLIGHKYQVEIMTSKTQVQDVMFIDYDKERVFKVGEFIPQTPVRAAISDFRNLHIEYHSIGNSNGNVKPVANVSADKKRMEVKV